MRSAVVDANVIVDHSAVRHLRGRVRVAEPVRIHRRSWPDPLTGLADASIVAVATTNRYDAVATFDRKLSNRLESFGLNTYW